jgi:hypothetical protein
MLESKTIAELNLMTKAQLITELTKDRTTTEITTSKDSPDGQVQRVYVTKDLAGSVIKTESWDWTYNKGVVSEIQHVVKDSKAVVTLAEKVVHTDGLAVMVAMDAKDISVAEVAIDVKG